MTTEIILTSGTSWTVPSDCTSATVECIGGGQGGNATNGGNGGDYAKANAVALTPGDTVAIAIGAGGAGVASGTQNAGTDTKFGTSVLAKGGGSASTNIGDTTFAGGAGDASGGGGGAAGPSAAGNAASGAAGGQGDGTSGGAGGASGSAGAAGAEWGTAGSGGGGGAAAAGSNPVVEVISGQATGSTAATATLTDVQVGDQIFVLGIQITGTPHTQIFTDTDGNTYSVQPLTIAQGAGYALITAAAAAASLTVSYTQSSGTSNRDIIVYHLRGTSAAVDTADVISAGSVSHPNGATTNFSVTAPAKALVVMALGVITNAGDNPTVVVDEMPGEVDDFTDSTSTFNEYLVAHMQSDAGYSAQNVGFHCSVQTSANTSNTYIAVPLSWA